MKLLAPAAKPVANKRFIDHGNIITAAGVSAGIDASLYVIAKTKGYDAAKSAASNMEYEHWIGFENEAKAVPVSDADGAISQDARVFEAGQWLIIDLIDAIQNEGPDAALSKYQQLVETAEGHQKEMLQEVSLIEVSTWLQDQSRDPELGLKLARFTTLAFPNSPGSFARYADACQRCRKHDEAIMAIRKAIELNPGDIELIGKLEELSKSSE